MAPTLYMLWGSPPVRAVLMAAKTIGLDLDLKEVDFSKNEHKTAQYLKINPQHTVPTLVDDDGFAIWDSHAIIPYLYAKYSDENSLYPKDIKRRAVIDQRLHFENGVALAHLLAVLRPFLIRGAKSIPAEHKERAYEIYELVEAFLQGKQWIAGDSLTIADFGFITTFTTMNLIIRIDSNLYPKLVAYLKRAETLPCYELNKKGLVAFEEWFKNLLAHNNYRV